MAGGFTEQARSRGGGSLRANAATATALPSPSGATAHAATVPVPFGRGQELALPSLCAVGWAPGATQMLVAKQALMDAGIHRARQAAQCVVLFRLFY